MDQAESPKLARVYSRLAAYLIDSLIVGAITFIIGTVVGLIILAFGITSLATLGSNLSSLTIPMIIVGLAVSMANVIILPGFYYGYFQSKNGQTPGLKFIGIKITSEDGSLLTFWKAFFRAIVATTLVSILQTTLGMIPVVGTIIALIVTGLWVGWCIFDKKAQNLYDKMFKTVYTPNNEETGRAKWVIGCWSCSTLAIVAIVATLAIIFGYTILSNPFKSVKTTSNQTTNTTTETAKTVSTTNEVKNSEFYKACASSAPTGVDFSAYCECATKEFESGQTDVNTIVNSCKSYLQK